MVLPVPALAPVIPPNTEPIVHEKVLGADAVKAMLGLVPLQVATVGAFVTTGMGLTVINIGVVAPVQPQSEVGVIKYCKLPCVELLGLVSVWFNVVPAPAEPPVIPPVLVPIDQVKELVVDAVSTVFGAIPLQIL